MNTKPVTLAISGLLAVLATAVSVLPGCSAETCAAISANPLGKAAIAAGSEFINPALICGDTGSSTGSDQNPGEIQPGSTVQSLNAPGGACAAVSSDDACTACNKAACCAETAACLTDGACAKVVDCRFDAKASGGDWSACGTDAKLDALAACLRGSCAQKCDVR